MLRVPRPGLCGLTLRAVAAVSAMLFIASAAAAQNTFKFTKMPATLSPTTGWLPAAAEWKPDDYTDIFGYHPSNGSVWPCHNEAGKVVCGTAPIFLFYDAGYRLLS